MKTKTVQLAPVNSKNPEVRSVVISEDEFDEYGIGTGGTKRMRVPVLRKNAEKALERIKSNIDDFEFGEELGAGWYEPLILSSGSSNQSTAAEHVDSEIEEEEAA